MSSKASGTPSALTPKRLVYCLFGIGVVAAGLLAPLLFEGHQQPLPADAPGEAITPLEGPEMGGMLFRLVGGTAAVLILCVGTLWLARRWIGVRPRTATAAAGLEIVESLQLVGLCRVHLVRAGERYLLTGMDGSGLKVVLPIEGALDGPNEESAKAHQVAGNAA
jgi:flagellar biogenesis protein FliO